MPAMLPIIVASTYLVLAADRVPQLDIGPSCRAVTEAVDTLRKSEDACRRDEHAALDKLEQKWTSFSAGQRNHCVRLSTLDGSQSYVELLTCLEIGKAAKQLPADG